MTVWVPPFTIGTMSSDENVPNDAAGVFNQVDLTELAMAWEGNRWVRSHFLESGSVVFSEPGKYHPSDTVNGVGANFETLAPVAHKLLLDGEDEIGRPRVGMVTIPQVEAESPIYSLSVLNVCCELQAPTECNFIFVCFGV